MLGGDEGVPQLPGEFVGSRQGGVEFAGHRLGEVLAGLGREPVHLARGFPFELRHADSGLLEQRPYYALLLLEECREKVRIVDRRIAVVAGKGARKQLATGMDFEKACIVKSALTLDSTIILIYILLCGYTYIYLYTF